MSVSRTDWILIGADIGFERYDDEHTDFIDTYAMQSHKGDITFLIDGMGGEYFVVGEVVSYGYDEGFGVTEISSDNFQEAVERVEAFLKLMFNIEDIKPKLIAVTHYT